MYYVVAAASGWLNLMLCPHYRIKAVDSANCMKNCCLLYLISVTTSRFCSYHNKSDGCFWGKL